MVNQDVGHKAAINKITFFHNFNFNFNINFIFHKKQNIKQHNTKKTLWGVGWKANKACK